MTRYLTLLAALLAAPTAGAQTQSELSAYYPVIEQRGDEVFELDDLTAPAVLLDGAYLGEGTSDSVVVFGDTDARMVVPADERLQPRTGSVEMWIQPETLKNADLFYLHTDTMVRSGQSGGWAVYGLRLLEDGGLRGMVLNDDPNASSVWTFVSTPPGVIQPLQAHHVALVWDGEFVRLVVDGTTIDWEGYDPIPGMGLSFGGDQGLQVASPSWWGAAYAADDRAYLGSIDEIKVWEGYRSDGDIQASMDDVQP